MAQQGLRDVRPTNGRATAPVQRRGVVLTAAALVVVLLAWLLPTQFAAATTTADTTPPSAPRDLSVVVRGDGMVVASWSASSDDRGVARYVVSRNNVVVVDDVTSTSVAMDLGMGDHWIQVRAVDTSGNVGVKTSPVKVTVGDTTPPSAPTDLVVRASNLDELTAEWTASTDHVGVTGYRVFRNGSRVDPGVSITATEHRIVVDDLVGTHVIEVRAVDAAGNESGSSEPFVFVQAGEKPDPVESDSEEKPDSDEKPGDEEQPGNEEQPDTEDPDADPQPDGDDQEPGDGSGTDDQPDPGDLPDAGAWDPLRARDEAGAVLPYRLSPSDLPATLVVDSAGGGQFTSIRAAISAAGRDDVIEVRTGVYRESLGVVNKPITIRAADGAHPVILGTDRIEAERFDGVGSTRSAQVWTSNPLKSLDSGLNESSYFYGGLVDLGDPASAADLLPEQVFRVDADGVWHELSQRRAGSALSTDMFSYDPTTRTFSVDVDWSRVSYFEVTTRREGLRLIDGADGSRVSGLEFRAFSPPTDGDGWATVATNGRSDDRLVDVVLRDIVVTDSASNGISAYFASDLTLTRVTADRNVVKGFNSGRVRSMRVEFSRFDDNNKDRLRDVHSILAGAKITGGNGDDPGSVIRYNSFAGNHSTGYWCDLWCENDVIVGNYAGDNSKHGLYYEVSEDAVIASNVLVRNGAAGVKVSGSQRVEVVRNTFVGNAQHIHLGTDTRPRTGPGDGNRRPGHPTVTDTADIAIDGNVFAEIAGSASWVIFRVGGADGAGDRNLPSERLRSYEQNGHSLNGFDGGFQRFEWDFGAGWQTATEFLAYSEKGSNEITIRDAEPTSVFADPVGGDWRLAPGSPMSGDAQTQALPSAAVSEMLGAASTASPVGAVFG